MSRDQLTSHIRSAHRNFEEDRLGRLVESGRQPVTTFNASDCPFCNDWSEALKNNLAKTSPEAQREIVVTTKRFRRHVAMHLEQLAIFAVPQHYNDDEDDDEDSLADSDSHQSSKGSDSPNDKGQAENAENALSIEGKKEDDKLSSAATSGYSALALTGQLLAVFPLALEFLERYKMLDTGVKPITARGLKDCEDKITFNYSVLKHFVERYLLPLMAVPQDEYHERMDNPDGDWWYAPLTAKHLGQCLGDEHEAYTSCVMTISEVMTDLVVELSWGQPPHIALQRHLLVSLFGINRSTPVWSSILPPGRNTNFTNFVSRRNLILHHACKRYGINQRS